MRIVLLFLLLLEFGLAKKIALVMGNSNYSKGYLANPINDAKLIAQTLRDVGFTVSIKKDLKTKTDMENAINAFASQVSKNDTVAIYYSGHGVQYNGRDYLMPIHANIAKKGQLPSVSLDVNFVLGGVSDAKLAIVMLDACRNNPYRSFIRGIPKGLGQASVNVDGGMIISYATEANNIANDGNGANSPYALALKKYIKSSDPIETVFRKVRGEVSRLTHKEQKPMTKMLFDGEFAFMAGYVPPPPRPIVVQAKPVYVPTPVPIVVKPKPISTSKWIKPTNSVCKANGGKIVKGVCQANWENAKKICSASGGKLPTRNDFKKEVIACGGIWEDWEKNNNNSSYQSCYKQKGFSVYHWTREEKDSSDAWGVDFQFGSDGWNGKSNLYCALCVR